MNWYTKRQMATHSSEAKQRAVAEWGGCTHVEIDPETLHMVSYENDSFGREGYGYCKACWDQEIEMAGNETRTCDDCHLPVKVKDSVEWKWYDFDYRQGDEPIIVCTECQGQDRHTRRVRIDARNREDEDQRYR